jgi:hypothetical protein
MMSAKALTAGLAQCFRKARASATSVRVESALAAIETTFS